MAENELICANCGTPILGESSGEVPHKRKPCPSCGSFGREILLTGHISAHTSLSGQLTIETYPQALLGTAKSLLKDDEFGISVVVDHMACEVAVERALSAAFLSKGVQYLEEPIQEFINGYNLGNDRIRKLYTSLTGDAIAQQPFWADFTKSATRRNKIVHEGKLIGKKEAESSYEAASLLVAYLNQ